MFGNENFLYNFCHPISKWRKLHLTVDLNEKYWEEERPAPFWVEVSRNQALKVGGVGLINRIQFVEGRSLWVEVRRSSTVGRRNRWVELFIEIQIKRELISTIAPRPSSLGREKIHISRGISFFKRDQCGMAKRLHDTLSLNLLQDSLTQRSQMQETEKGEHNRPLRLPYTGLWKARREKPKFNTISREVLCLTLNTETLSDC